MDQIVASAQTQCLNQGKNLGKDGKTHVNWTGTIHYQVFWKGLFSIRHNLWSPQDALPLPLNFFFFSHGVAFEIGHSPTWTFQTKMLILWK